MTKVEALTWYNVLTPAIDTDHISTRVAPVYSDIYINARETRGNNPTVAATVPKENFGTYKEHFEKVWPLQGTLWK